MLKKLTNLITNNFWLKILGIVFAVIIWMAVVNVQDPDKAVTFSVQVEVVNGDFLTDIGKTYEILDGTDTISFTVTGQRSIVENLSASDFKAVANIENIDDSMSIVPIVITATSYSSQLEITTRSSYLKLNVENLVTQEYEIEVIMEGTPATGCFVNSVDSSPETVTVTGPESVVNRISTAQVTLNVDGATDDVSSTEPIALLDESGEEVSQERLTLDAAETVAAADILMRKTVSLSFEVEGESAENTRYTGIQSEVSSVTLEGDRDVLNAMTSLDITSDQLNVEGAGESLTVQIYLPDYLPEGVSLADGEKEEITVILEIEAQTTVEVEMPTDNITVSGLAEGLSLSYDSDTVAVTITGYADDLDSVSGEDLTAVLDASGLQTGTYEVGLTLEGDYAETAAATVSVTVTDDSTEEEETESENNSEEE
ncbi:MAG: hypothetical protein LUF32_09575 [Clostridiales bacterium]|nr:hypothetical protein [Clostridiales bacterium]